MPSTSQARWKGRDVWLQSLTAINLRLIVMITKSRISGGNEHVALVGEIGDAKNESVPWRAVAGPQCILCASIAGVSKLAIMSNCLIVAALKRFMAWKTARSMSAASAVSTASTKVS